MKYCLSMSRFIFDMLKSWCKKTNMVIRIRVYHAAVIVAYTEMLGYCVMTHHPPHYTPRIRVRVLYINTLFIKAYLKPVFECQICLFVDKCDESKSVASDIFIQNKNQIIK